MKLNKEIVFVGAQIKYKEKMYEVVKINTKSIYITQDKELSKKMRLKLKGLKTIDLIKSASLMVDIVDCEIDELEVARKVNAEKVAELKKKQKKVLGTIAQRALDAKIAKAINPKNKTGSWKNMFEVEQGKFCTVLAVNKEKKAVLISIEGEKWFYNYEMDLYSKFINEKHHPTYGSLVWEI